MTDPLQRIMRYVGKHGIVRPRDIEAIGLPREYLIRLHRQGRLNRSGRGIYVPRCQRDGTPLLRRGGEACAGRCYLLVSCGGRMKSVEHCAQNTVQLVGGTETCARQVVSGRRGAARGIPHFQRVPRPTIAPSERRHKLYFSATSGQSHNPHPFRLRSGQALVAKNATKSGAPSGCFRTESVLREAAGAQQLRLFERVHDLQAVDVAGVLHIF
jgi:hypothetical protein